MKDLLIQEITETLEANGVIENDPDNLLAEELAENVMFILEREGWGELPEEIEE